MLFDLVRDINTQVADWQKNGLTPFALRTMQEGLDLLMELAGILGLLGREDGQALDKGLEAEVEALIAQRQNARKEKNWTESDRIRDKLKDIGIEIQDTPQGVKWTRKS